MQYLVSGHPDNAVSGLNVLAILNSLPAGRDYRLELVQQHHGTRDVDPDAWYSEQNQLNLLRELEQKVGPKTIFTMGKAIIDNAIMPPLSGLEEALRGLDYTYRLNVRGQNMGAYDVTAFDADARKAQMTATTPYPDDFDLGIITGLARRFKPVESINVEVMIDFEQPTRAAGGQSTVYRIRW